MQADYGPRLTHLHHWRMGAVTNKNGYLVHERKKLLKDKRRITTQLAAIKGIARTLKVL